jgi:MFS family permease
VAGRAVRRLAAAFTYRDFRVMWLGAFTSSVGTWMQSVAQAWLVLTLTQSPFFLGLDAFLGQLPIMLLTLIGGVVADRRDRRRLLLMSQCIQMTAAFTLAGLVYWDVVRIWHILMLSFMTGCAQAFGGPAYQSLLPSLVRKDDLPNALALN